MPGPDYHGRTHLPGGTDPIPGVGRTFVVADTVAGLGPPFEGKAGLLRVGSSPYGEMALIHDGEKWMSPYFPGPTLPDTTLFTLTSTSYAAVSPHSRGWLGAHSAWYTAGLRLQVDGAIFLKNSGGSDTTYARLAVIEYTSGDPATADLWTSTSEMSNTGTTGRYQSAAWNDVTAGSPAETEAFLVFQGKVSAGTGSFSAGAARFRWVSA